MAERSKGTGQFGSEPEPGRSIGDIRRDIDERRQSISETVSELDERVKSAFDWREYPWWALGCAALAGFAVARMIKPAEGPGERLVALLGDNAERLSRRFEGESERSGLGALAVGVLATAAGRAASHYFVERYARRGNGNPTEVEVQDRATAFTDIERI